MKTKILYMFFLAALLSACATGYTPAATASEPAIAPATDTATDAASTTMFTLTSPDVAEGGRLPVECTCDGEGSTLPLAWSGAPAGTKGFAVIMSHVAPETTHWYWVLYNLPVDVTGLEKNISGVGTLGNNINNGLAEYSPPCSKGPGDKTYTYTVYALSAQPQLSVPASEVDRATLLASIEDITLASAELNVVYARP
jgi:Raf kinase inhibitor-like YbhB/YbcL family protein